MPLNGKFLSTLREKHGITRPEFAAALGISYGGLYKYETGARKPGRDILEKAAFVLGLPDDIFVNCYGDESDLSGNEQNLLELTRRLVKERFDKKCLEQRIIELEKQNEHLVSISELHARQAEILRLDLPKNEKAKKLANLARNTAKSGEICFNEIADTLKIDRATLRRWLGSKKSIYACQLFSEKTVEAFTPDEAGIRLQCFDCESNAAGDCNGYGNVASPEDFFAVIALLEANGINDRDEQARFLRESYKIVLTAHQISEYISRKKGGKPVPPDVVNLQPYKRK